MSRTGIYASAKGQILGQTLSLLAAGIKAMPLTEAYVPDYSTHATLSDVPGGTRVVAGVNLTNKTLVKAGTAYKFDADDVPFAGVPNPSTIAGVLLYLDGGSDSASKLIGYFDYFAGMPVTVTTGTVMFRWSTYAIFVLDDGVLGGPQGASGSVASIPDPVNGVLAKASNTTVRTALKTFISPTGLLELQQSAKPSNPASGNSLIYPLSTTGRAVQQLSDGTVLDLTGPRGSCSLEQFGAVGDGTTDDTTALEAAEAALAAGTYHTIVLGAKTYKRTSGSFTIPANCSIIGQGSGASVLLTTANAPVIVIGGEDVFVGRLTVMGNSTGTSQHGISDGVAATPGSGHSRVIIDGVKALSFGGCGLYYCQNPLNGGASTYNGPLVTNLIVDGCLVAGVWIDTRGEYIRFSNCSVQRCNPVGVIIGAGNVGWVGGSITANAINIKIISGDNDAHGEFVGVAVNHAILKGLVCDSILNGMQFTQCDFFENQGIWLTATLGISFIGCRIDVGSYNFDGAKGTTFKSCTFSGAYGNTVNNDVNAHPSATRWVDCHYKDDASIPPWVSDQLRLAYTFGSDANATLSLQQSLAEEIVIASGVLTAPRTLTIDHPPVKGERRFVTNSNAQAVSIKWSSGTSVSVPAGLRAIVGADGTNAKLLLVETAAGSGEANTMSSAGGASIVQAKSGVNLPVRGFIGTAPIDVTQNTNDLTLSLVGGSNGQFLTWQSGVAAWGNLANFVGLGTGTLATAGLVRMQSAVSQIVVAGTKTVLATSSTEGFLFTDSSFANGCDVGRIYAGTTLYFGLGSTTYTLLNGGNVRVLKPLLLNDVIGGDPNGTTPFRFRDTLIDLTGVSTHTATIAEHTCPRIYVTRTTGATCEVVMPNGYAGAAWLVTIDSAIAGLEVRFTHVASGAGPSLSTGQTRWVVWDALQNVYVLGS